MLVKDGLAITRAMKVAGFAQGGATGEGTRPTVAAGSGLFWKMLRQATGLSIGASGKLVDAQGLDVASLVHKNEYVIPKWRRADLQVVQVEHWLEARRLKGYAQGGATSDGGSQATGLALAGLPAAATSERLVRVLDSLDQCLQRVEQWPTSLEVVLNLLGLTVSRRSSRK